MSRDEGNGEGQAAEPRCESVALRSLRCEHRVEQILVGKSRELIDAHFVQGFGVGIDAQRISLAVELSGVERHDVLMPGEEAPRFDDQKRDVPSRRIARAARLVSAWVPGRLKRRVFRGA